ncbi:cobalt-precorrin-5B (C1)-methyltransferase [Streptomyces sp. MnatMP-M27]|nr:cobalt-precorrin-5B (C1)-methyltransferase [Streptomyces sp. MnatMP-M27]
MQTASVSPAHHGGQRLVAMTAREEALTVLRGAPVAVDVICIDRAGTIVGRSAIR